MYSISEFESEIKKIIDSFVSNKHLDVNNVVFKEKKEEKGVATKSLQFVEYEYPPDPNKRIQGSVSKPIMRVEYKVKHIAMHVPVRAFDSLPDLENAVVKRNEKTKFAMIIIEELSPRVFEYIEQAMTYSYANYSPSQESMACCSRYEECSDAKHCIHENKLYAKKCLYRGNLEAGRVFYGKNRNNW